MNSSLLFERADGYLQAQLQEPRLPRLAPRRFVPFVTISREAGSGGSSLARLLARRLNADAPREVFWRVYEGALTGRMLAENALPPRVARFLPEDRFVEPRTTIGEVVGLHPNLWDLVQKTNQSIRQLAAGGHAIIVGRGANFATAGLPDGIHVRLVAPAEHRARYVAARYSIAEKRAAALNAKCETGRRRYVRANFNAEVDDPYAYDLIINTGRTPLEAAVDVICARLTTLGEAVRLANEALARSAPTPSTAANVTPLVRPAEAPPPLARSA